MPKKKSNIVLSVNPVMHIFCEGLKTEPNYINFYIQYKFPDDNRRRRVIKIEPTKKNTPRELVIEAVNLKKSLPPKDEVWVVYDRESTHKYPDSIHNAALSKAINNGVNVALSNICFEIWLLLHFCPNSTFFSCYDDLMKNSALKTYLRELGIEKYDKSDYKLPSLLKDKIDHAREKAKAMNANSLAHAENNKTEIYQLNPYTNFYALLDAIDKF